ncbi:uncharacterized protein LOC110816424 [Carica papaya]|uniref:uncharacterized protein LOC110816424 n=1 Tax=Carica papaya TaxID=3649 RepID=UPI000B8C6E25|nr:uncharacterized protein LOC110816424 [Carica papaya]
MKHWAKAHDINSSKDRTLNSLSIISLVAFHLQTRNPPILPPFSVLLKDGADPVDVGRVVQKYINYGKKNEESLAELFVTLLIKLASVEKLWHQGLCVSLFDGLWISKTWDSGIGSISIEDFVYRSVNFARAVSRAGAKKIYSCIHHSIGHIGSFLEGQIQESQCKELIFGSDVSTMATVQDMVCQNLHKDTVKHPIDPEHHQRKKMRLTGIFEETRLAQSSEGEHNEPGWNGSLFAKERGTLHLEQCRTLLDDNRRESGYLNFRSDKWQNHAGNSGLMPPAHARQFPSQTRVASSFDNARFYDPQKLPPVPFPYPTGFGESHEPLPQFSPILQNHPGFFRPMSSHGPFYGKQTLNHQEFIP